jgi:quercetin dioxygenase-like cupin family protein
MQRPFDTRSLIEVFYGAHTMKTPSADHGQVRDKSAKNRWATHGFVDEKRNVIDGESSMSRRWHRRRLGSALAVVGATLAFLGATAHGWEGDKPVIPVLVAPVLTTATTATGQPIELPQTNARVAVSIYDIAPNATLPEHKHPFARYAYVLAGMLRITNTETGNSSTYRTGDFIVEAIGQWHKAVGLDDRPVKLLVIDQVPDDPNRLVTNNTVTRK